MLRAISELERGRGAEFDPTLVGVIAGLVDKKQFDLPE